MPSQVNTANFNSISTAISRILQEGSTAVLATLIQAANDVGKGVGKVGAKLLVEEPRVSGASIGGLGNAELDQSVVEYAANFLESREETRVLEVKEFAPQLVEHGDTQILDRKSVV